MVNPIEILRIAGQDKELSLIRRSIREQIVRLERGFIVDINKLTDCKETVKVEQMVVIEDLISTYNKRFRNIAGETFYP